MLKLIIHLFVAGLIAGIGNGAGLQWYFIVPLVLVGGIAVHFIWERLFFDPFLYLGARPVDSQDPLMIAAKQKALSELPQFERLFAERPTDSMIKFAFQTDKGETEFLWGDLLELSETETKVFLRTPPINHSAPLDRAMKVPREAIVDWQVEFPDGTLRGGYSNLALFKIFEREEGTMHPKFLEQIERFKELATEPNG
jgi:uncharacterized protein YegJ (DUF2314 family)